MNRFLRAMTLTLLLIVLVLTAVSAAETITCMERGMMVAFVSGLLSF